MTRLRHLRWVAIAIVAALIIGRIVFHYAAEITIKGAFFDAIGMGGAYDRRWQTSVVLALIGIVICLVLALAPLFVARAARGGSVVRPVRAGPSGPLTEAEIDRIRRRLERDDVPEPVEFPSERVSEPVATWMKRVGWAGFAAAALLLIASVVPSLVTARDDLMAARDAVSFGQVDPVFGRDVSFFVFVEPALRQIVGLVLSAAFLTGLVAVGTGAAIWYAERQRGANDSAAAVLERTVSVAYAAAGVLVACIGATLWLSRYELTVTDGEVVAGAGAATRAIDIPTRAVAGVVIMLLGLGLIALSVRSLRRRIIGLPAGTLARGAVMAVAAIVALLVVLASPWWLVLLIPVAIAATVLWRMRPTVWQAQQTPFWAPAVGVVVAMIVLSAIGPIGAALNDAIVLRGSQLQVERENIRATLDSTRVASGISEAESRTADYKQNGVTRKAIAAAPASTGSLRFLDRDATLAACLREQTFDQFYICNDVDMDRYTFGGTRQTTFSIGREISYDRATDFQRRHFTYTHGNGLVLAPVNQIDSDGRPNWIARNIPQVGPLTLERPEIYFGAQPEMPWSMVNTTQRVLVGPDKLDLRTWEGSTGIEVGSGWQRLAMTEFLGGLPYVGGGRRVWNATSGRPANGDSKLLLYRDIQARVGEIAPFLSVDDDPWFAGADGRLWVMANTYVTSARYPYAAKFGGANYIRTAAVAVMDAYSGETKLYVVDPEEPMTRTWRSVYPELFTEISKMPQGVRAHMRFGEDLFNFQSAAIQRFHVTDEEAFFNGNQNWALTQEILGRGEGTTEPSEARYTYAVLPGDRTERFELIRSFKPATTGRGIGFSAWLAASNEPDDFGKLTIVDFPANQDDPLVSLDTFTANVGRDPQLSLEIGQRRDSNVLRGNTIVAPIGEGLLYVQPLYLDTASDSLPRLFKVVVSLGDGNVYSAGTFDGALDLALQAAGQGGGGSTPDAAPNATADERLDRAQSELDAYQAAIGRGDYVEAGRRLEALKRVLGARAAPTTP